MKLKVFISSLGFVMSHLKDVRDVLLAQAKDARAKLAKETDKTDYRFVVIDALLITMPKSCEKGSE